MGVGDPLYFDVYSLFLHHHYPDLAVTSLYVAVVKRSQLVCSSPRLLRENLREQKKLLGLIIATLSGLPEECRYVEDEGELITETELRTQLCLLEGELTLLEGEEWEENSRDIARKLVGKGELRVGVSLARQCGVGWREIATILAEGFEKGRNSVEFCQQCKEVLNQDESGHCCCVFVEGILKKCDVSGIPTFVHELILDKAAHGVCWCEGVVGVLLKYGRILEACSILVPFLRVACRNTAVWVPLKQVEVVISVINDAEGKREISEMMRNQLSGWRKKLESVRFARVDSDSVDKLIQKEDEVKLELSEDDKKSLDEMFKSVLPQGNEYTVEARNLGETAVPVLITQNEFMRRYREMSAMGGGMNFYGSIPESYNIIVNMQNPLVAKIWNDRAVEGDNDLLRQVVDLALLSNGMLKGKDLSDFVARSEKLLGK